MKIGPAEDPANAVGAVVDAAAQKRIRDCINIGMKEGHLIFGSQAQAEDTMSPSRFSADTPLSPHGPGGDLRPGPVRHAGQGSRSGD